MKRKNKFDPFENLVLDDEEKAIEEAFEKGAYEVNPDFAKTKRMLQEAAKHYLELHRAKPVTLRVNQLDLIKIKAKAKKKNIPYQTLLGALLHDFAEEKRELTI